MQTLHALREGRVVILVCARALVAATPGRGTLETLFPTHSHEWHSLTAAGAFLSWPLGCSRCGHSPPARMAWAGLVAPGPMPGCHLWGLLLLQVKQALGLKGLFLRGTKPGSLDSHAAGRPLPRPSVSQRLLRRTASAPTKSQKPSRKAFPELVLGTQDTGSEGEARDVAAPSPGPVLEASAPEEPGSRSPRGKAPAGRSPAGGSLAQEPPSCVPEGPGPAGMAATCMKCVVGSCAGEDAEGLRRGQLPSPGPTATPEAISQQPRARADSLGAPCATAGTGRGAPWQGPGGGGGCSASSDSSGLGSPEVVPRWPEGAHRQAGAMQREMNALFVQKLEEIRSKSSMLSTGKTRRSAAASSVLSLHTPLGMA